MPPRRITNRQTEQGSTSTEVLNAAATPMETLLKRFQSFKPPTLTGTESAIDCENWLEDIEQLFEALEYTDERRVKLIIHQLHGIGKSWWIATNKALENQGTVITWAARTMPAPERSAVQSYQPQQPQQRRQGGSQCETWICNLDLSLE
ncbi:hypothetical protein F511_44662 [Dorcoceras hygrometricum]|uniref:Uncharacterized protein n=1 Tax=Dorcoceras hygrometricum TaxID=472368 RepID=A0A2Z7AB20_9LAMI|nr:hypothetical protein F511_44662 [Dorcoceras hygrometricum]